ncbi:MAG: 1-acyl-sn-glycerol-3-phosphate acyltransferase [Sphaerochaetaceae bacterium]|nr:1-acyl-sn-glycerol-3-phosphate acyltransferase [Sphaerochaetaceae bacterium]
MVILKALLYIIISVLGLFVGMVLLWALTGILYSLTVTRKVYKRSTPLARFLGAFTTWALCFFSRSHVRVIGEDLIPKDTRFVYVANHRSRFDPMVVMYKLARYRVAFISKPSNFKIPFFGKILRKMCFLEIDRFDPRAAMDTVNNAVDILKAQASSIGFYPEGTRSKDGKLGPFHGFMFRIPKSAGVPVVVAVTYDTEQIAKRFPFPGGARVTIKILGVLDRTFVSTHKPVEISETVEAMIREELGQ